MILVIGGAGYIGSHLVKELIETHKVVVLDNLTTGFKNLVDDRAIFIKGDLGDEEILEKIFTRYNIEAVMHFAALSLVGNSVKDPQSYYINNISNTLVLLKTMLKFNVKNFIFSSTAATYGIPTDEFITESTLKNPINPYGKTKLAIEWALEDYHRAYGLNYVIFRYFNASGAHHSGQIGECHLPETHLIPIILQHLNGDRESIAVFGTDYDTLDGTCIRDYIHVTDLASAHILGLNALLNNNLTNEVFNLGNKRGYSVLEIIETCEEVTNKKAKVIFEERRMGDPDRLVAESKKALEILKWEPKYNLKEIISTAWEFHSNKKLQEQILEND